MAHQKEDRLQLLNTLYTLDKSYATEIMVGLEYISFRDEYYEPVVRLLGDDSNGIAFAYDGWLQFRDCFNEFFKYLCGPSSEDMTGQQICGTGWIAKFTHSGKDRAIEIEDNTPPRTLRVLSKRYCATIIMKKVKFIRLNEYIVKCIDARLEYLKLVAGSVSCVARETIEYIKSVDLDNIPLMNTAVYTTTFVKQIINLIGDKWFDIITASVQTRARKFKDQIPFSRNHIVDVFY